VCHKLVSHTINDVVDSQTKGQRFSPLGVARTVGPLPGIADIGVMADCDHDAAPVIADTSPVGHRAVGGLIPTAPDIARAGNLEPLIKIVEDMK
jgi:hypothetical protein